MSETIQPEQGREPNPVEKLALWTGSELSNLSKARLSTQKELDGLAAKLAGLDNEDTSIVIFGSLARFEATHASDIDWTLLIDGKADPKHHSMAKEIESKLDADRRPGREGTFGKLAFSHQILHFIGGSEDSNANITRRILLLLESRAIGNGDAWNSVQRNLLSRYLTEDHGLWQKRNSRSVPLFLLNDISRYWRTMVVDFAYKQRDRSNEGYALRNLKLGLSRKLIYASGILACLSCDPGLSRQGLFESSKPQRATQYLLETFRKTPLEILASTLLQFEMLKDPARRAFLAYDEFVGLLAEEDAGALGLSPRKHLEELPVEGLETDPVFARVREIRRRFGEALLDIFLRIDSPIQQLMIERGVF